MYYKSIAIESSSGGYMAMAGPEWPDLIEFVFGSGILLFFDSWI